MISINKLRYTNRAYVITNGSEVSGVRLSLDLSSVDGKTRERCFKYWSKIWSQSVKGEEIVWRKINSASTASVLRFDGKVISFDLYKQWFILKGWTGKLKTADTNPEVAKQMRKMFKVALAKIAPSFSFMPVEYPAICWAQISLFMTPQEVVEKLATGKRKNMDKLKALLHDITPVLVQMVQV